MDYRRCTGPSPVRIRPGETARVVFSMLVAESREQAVALASLGELRTGAAVVGNPGTNGFGTLTQGFLELANVKVVDEIVSAAKELQSDVIVMTSHVSRLTRLFRGSFTERVIRKAPCPVLTILPSAEVRTDKDERVPVRLIDKWAA